MVHTSLLLLQTSLTTIGCWILVIGKGASSYWVVELKSEREPPWADRSRPEPRSRVRSAYVQGWRRSHVVCKHIPRCFPSYLRELSVGIKTCLFAVYHNLQRPENIDVLSFPDKYDTNSPIPRGEFFFLAWGRNPNQESGIRCTRQQAPPLTALYTSSNVLGSIDRSNFTLLKEGVSWPLKIKHEQKRW